MLRWKIEGDGIEDARKVSNERSPIRSGEIAL